MKPNLNSSNKSIKFLYSYGGKILPRHSDGQLRYVGGHIRILSVDRFITVADLMAKFEESCGSSMKLKCKLPTEDLDVLVSITSDDDFANIVDEYIRASSSSHQDLKIRAILFPLKTSKNKNVHPPISSVSSVDSSGTTVSPSVSGFPIGFQRRAGRVQRHPCCREGRNMARFNLIPRWSHKSRLNLA